MSVLQPINLPPARERAASEIRKAIFSKQIKKGEVLSLEGIAKQLNISVTPIREAFQILARSGLIELRPNKGALVLGITEKYIREHYQLRSILECASVSMLCQLKSDTSKIENAFNNAKIDIEKNDFSKYADYNQAFHFEIWKAAKNERMQDLLSELWNGLSIGSFMSVEDYSAKSLKEHEDILNAILKYDEKKAVSAMKYHIERSMEDILS